MMKSIHAVSVVSLLAFILISSEMAGLTEVPGSTSSVVNPQIAAKAKSLSEQTSGWRGQAGWHPVVAATNYNQRVTGNEESNNVKALLSSAPKPDLIIETITWSPVNPSKGDNVTFTVTIKNQGSGRALPSRVDFYVDGFFKDYQDVPMIDTGALMIRTFIWTAGAGSHDFKLVVDEEDWIPESDEDNNEKTVTVVTLPPDLIIQAITWSPANPLENDDVTFTVTIKNQGSGRAEYCPVAFYVDDVYLAFAAGGSLDPGAIENTTFSWVAQAGSHTIKAVADPHMSITESDESNNEKTVTFPTLAPDLIIQAITWSPASLSVGQSVIFTVTIKNQGNAVAGSSHVYFNIGGSLTVYQSVQRIAPGGVVTETFTWIAQAGSHAIKAAADPHDKVLESDENNNEKGITFSDAAPPDLIIQDITWSPVSSSVGEKVTFTVTIKNQGSGKADYSHVAYYIDDTQLASAYVAPIEPGATANRTFSWIAQADSHAIKAIADFDRRIPEANEDNNGKTVFYPVALDLVIQAITWLPTNPSAGDNMTFTATIKNQGAGTVHDFNVAYYIDDAYLAFVPVGSIDAGSTVNSTFNWDATAYWHAIAVVVDPLDKVLESDENNNKKSASFLVLPPPTSEPTPAPESSPSPESSETSPTESTPSSLPEKRDWQDLWMFLLPVVVLGGMFLAVFLRRRRRQK